MKISKGEWQFMKKIKKIILIIIITSIILITLFGSFILFKGYSMYKSAIKKKSIEATISEIQEKEHFIKVEDIPDIFKSAVIAAEDKRFYTHKGIDFRSIGRAVKTNLKNKELTEGGSTITQQISKNLFFTQEKDFTRKIAEIFAARNIEKLYSKKEILEIYININYYGSRILWNL